jgi:hypothetical protein
MPRTANSIQTAKQMVKAKVLDASVVHAPEGTGSGIRAARVGVAMAILLCQL